MAPDELRETIALLRKVGGPGVNLITGALAIDPRLSFASMSECMVVGISGGCGLLCPVLHAGRCDVQEDFREDALQVLAALSKATGEAGE
ncbi:MAG: hypothetical protein ACK4RV_10405 [Caulobacter sp.]